MLKAHVWAFNMLLFLWVLGVEIMMLIIRYTFLLIFGFWTMMLIV